MAQARDQGQSSPSKGQGDAQACDGEDVIASLDRPNCLCHKQSSGSHLTPAAVSVVEVAIPYDRRHRWWSSQNTVPKLRRNLREGVVIRRLWLHPVIRPTGPNKGFTFNCTQGQLLPQW
jgi:hypothetical protein